jgi:hypothetical protein
VTARRHAHLCLDCHASPNETCVDTAGRPVPYIHLSRTVANATDPQKEDTAVAKKSNDSSTNPGTAVGKALTDARKKQDAKGQTGRSG